MAHKKGATCAGACWFSKVKMPETQRFQALLAIN
jgi:hypothetical protein